MASMYDYINAFCDWRADAAPSSYSVALYLGLINKFNRNFWPESIQLTTDELLMLSGGSTKRTAYAARDALIEGGFVEYTPGNRGRSASYKLAIPDKYQKQAVDHSFTDSRNDKPTLTEVPNTNRIIINS